MRALETVRRNVRLMQEKKIDEMMETIHPQSPALRDADGDHGSREGV